MKLITHHESIVQLMLEKNEYNRNLVFVVGIMACKIKPTII